MTSILIVERTGELKQLTVKQFDKTELFKKAGFKVADGFDEHATWQVKLDSGSYTVSLYAKTKGRAGQENKYDFPPPVDTTLFFGNVVLVRWADEQKTVASNISVKQWEEVYEDLFGGFEDLDDTAEADEEELLRPDTPVLDKNGAVVPVSKHGYLLDGFIVDDSDSMEATDDGFETEEEIIVKPKTKKSAKPKETKPKDTKPKDDAKKDDAKPKKESKSKKEVKSEDDNTEESKKDEAKPKDDAKKDDAKPKKKKTVSTEETANPKKRSSKKTQPTVVNEVQEVPVAVADTNELEEESYFY
jgi:hypothetical protein